MKTTPLEITMLIHYHVSAEEFPSLRFPAQQEAVEKFIQLGLLERIPKNYYGATLRATELASDYVRYLTSIPLPRG